MVCTIVKRLPLDQSLAHIARHAEQFALDGAVLTVATATANRIEAIRIVTV